MLPAISLIPARMTTALGFKFITSGLNLTDAEPPEYAYISSDIDGAAVNFKKSVGTKCERCWKILPDVGNYKHPGTCKRCSTALK